MVILQILQHTKHLFLIYDNICPALSVVSTNDNNMTYIANCIFRKYISLHNANS